MLWNDELQIEQIQAAGLDSWESTGGRRDISIYNGSGLVMISSDTSYHRSHVCEGFGVVFGSFCLQKLFIFVWKYVVRHFVNCGLPHQYLTLVILSLIQ